MALQVIEHFREDLMTGKKIKEKSWLLPVTFIKGCVHQELHHIPTADSYWGLTENNRIL